VLDTFTIRGAGLVRRSGRAARLDDPARVVDEDVQPAVPVLDLAHRLARTLVGGHVETHGRRLGPLPGEGVRNGLSAGEVAAADDDGQVPRGQLARDLAPDAPVGAGHERDGLGVVGHAGLR
jgi:hypothetical protein